MVWANLNRDLFARVEGKCGFSSRGIGDARSNLDGVLVVEVVLVEDVDSGPIPPNQTILLFERRMDSREVGQEAPHLGPITTIQDGGPDRTLSSEELLNHCRNVA